MSRFLLFRFFLLGTGVLVLVGLVLYSLSKMPPKEALAVTGTLIIPSTTQSFTTTNLNVTNLVLGGVTVTATAAQLNAITAKAPLASPAFTGNTSFDTDTLYIDATNHRVGIGTTAPGVKFDMVGNYIRLTSSGATALNLVGTKSWSLMTGLANLGSTDNIGIWDPSAGAARLVVNTSGNVGIGTTGPLSQLSVGGVGAATYAIYASPTGFNSTGVYGTATGGGNGLYGNADGGGAGVFGWNSSNGLGVLGENNSTGDGVAGINLSTGRGGYFSSVSGYALITNVGNVGIGTTAPDSKLHVNGALETSSAGVNHYYNVLSYYIGASAQTGTLKITMPTAKYGSNTMLHVVIKGYDYTGAGAWQVIIGGYNYSTHTWYNHSAQISGRAPFNQVRLANNGTNDMILLGVTSTVWTYGTVEVSDVITTYGGTTGWGSGWTGALITSETGIVNIVAPTLDIYTSSTGNVGIGTTAPTYKLQVGGSVYMSGSSRRFKQNISGLEVDSEKIYDLRPVSFDYKPLYKSYGKELGSGRQIGLIAEEVYNVIPELAVRLDGKISNVDYEKLSILLLSETQKQKKEIDSLKLELKTLNERLLLIESKLK